MMDSCAATLDLSNLNVNDFQFFRYQQRLPNGELKPVPPPSTLSIENHFHRAKAGKYILSLWISGQCLVLIVDGIFSWSLFAAAFIREFG